MMMIRKKEILAKDADNETIVGIRRAYYQTLSW